ncbi:MAG TPA: acetoin utilization protein AcuC [Dehalococcoidia bacterium]|nr:acetoin utilization protein AcuC [Dehalococcoidia bacterium]
MSGRVTIVYGDEFALYNFGREHPLDRLGPLLSFELARRLIGDDPNVRFEPPPAATRDEVLLFHTPDYYDRVAAACATGEGFLDYGDTPAFPGGLEASQYIVGGSLLAARRIAAGEADHAFNLGGGLHHAAPDSASGFCIFNDAAVAIAWLLGEGGYRCVAYIDIDAHHGDGVMYGFYADDRVLDIDFHEDGRFLFPGTGSVPETGDGAARGLKANVPLPPYAGDADFRAAFSAVVPPLVETFSPEVILMQCGADGHAGDPLTHLQYGLDSYHLAVEMVHRLAHQVAGGRLILFGGGGYNLANVGTAWGTIAARLAGAPVPEETPADWRDLFENATGQPAPVRLRSPAAPGEIRPGLQATLDDLKRRLGLF